MSLVIMDLLVRNSVIVTLTQLKVIFATPYMI